MSQAPGEVFFSDIIFVDEKYAFDLTHKYTIDSPLLGVAGIKCDRHLAW